MRIDCHAHVSAPQQLWAYKAGLLAARGTHGRGAVAKSLTDDQLRAAANGKMEGAPHGHLDYIKTLGTDLQLLSPRPYQLMHSEQPGILVQWFGEECNDIIHRQCQLFPDKFVGVAGLPQVAGEDMKRPIAELERCVKQLGFKGCLLNPDPYENSGTKAPWLGDRYWYPLYEKLCELDVPALIHGTGSRCPEREPYTMHFINEETTAVFGLARSDVFKDFPKLKIVCSHGGGAVPYQFGRFAANNIRVGKDFRDNLRQIYYDTVLYTQDAIELLIKTVGADRCLFGSECPGTGSVIDPKTNKPLDDVGSYIDNISWLKPAEKKMIFEDTARTLFRL